MDRQLLFFVAIASVAAAESRIDFQRRGSRVDASVYLEASPATNVRVITDVRGYNRPLPRFMRARSMGATGRRLRMRGDLQWPCPDIEAILVRVAGGHGTERW